MDEFSTTIITRAYQSYLCGGDIYSIKLQSSNSRLLQKYEKALAVLENDGLITVLSKSDTKIKLSLTDEGFNYCNGLII